MFTKKLEEFRTANQVCTVGTMGTALIVTRKAMSATFPLDLEGLLTRGGGQVAGLSGSAINKILLEYGVVQRVGTESGRTSRGTPTVARSYGRFLNEAHTQGLANLVVAEKWWVDRFIEFFATEPFHLKYDASKTLRFFVEGLLEQALARQKLSSGKKYVGAMLQHLVGAKLELALPSLKINHHGFEVADSVSARSGDFVIDDTVLHVTTAPMPSLFEKCHANLNAALRPIIVTLPKMVGSIDSQLEQAGIEGRVEAIDAVQFLAVNLYEMSLFKGAQRKITVENLAKKYNAIVHTVESDESLLIRIDGESPLM